MGGLGSGGWRAEIRADGCLVWRTRRFDRRRADFDAIA